MAGTILKKELKDRRISTGIIGTSLGLFALLFAALFESVAGELDGYLESIPKGFESVIGDLAAVSEPAGWLGIELYSLFLPFAIAISAVIYGANTIGKEEESGTLELVLASPISRSKIMIQKGIGLAAQAALIAGMTWGGVAIGTVLFNFDVSLVNVFWASFSAWLLGLVYGYFALAAQSLKGKRTFGAAAGAGFLALTYFFNLVADQVGALEFLKYLSPFYYFNVQNILLTGANITNFAVLALCAVAFYIVAYVKFMNRDTGT